MNWGSCVSGPDGKIVRELRESDVAQVRRLIHHTIDVCYSGVYPPRAVRFFKEFHSDAKILERHQAGEILVVEQEGNVVATGAIADGEIFGVFVHPEFQHHGLGRALMDELEIPDEASRVQSLYYESFMRTRAQRFRPPQLLGLEPEER